MLDTSIDPAAPRAASTALEALARIPVAIRDVMTRQVTTLSLDDSVFDAVQLFGECGFRHVLVTDPTGRFEGVVSDRDALRSMARGRAADQTRVADIMARDGVVAGPDMSLLDAIDVMAFYRVHCLPVVDVDGKVCGIVTTTDLLGAFHEFLDRLRVMLPA